MGKEDKEEEEEEDDDDFGLIVLSFDFGTRMTVGPCDRTVIKSAR